MIIVIIMIIISAIDIWTRRRHMRIKLLHRQRCRDRRTMRIAPARPTNCALYDVARVRIYNGRHQSTVYRAAAH